MDDMIPLLNVVYASNTRIIEGVSGITPPHEFAPVLMKQDLASFQFNRGRRADEYIDFYSIISRAPSQVQPAPSVQQVADDHEAVVIKNHSEPEVPRDRSPHRELLPAPGQPMDDGQEEERMVLDTQDPVPVVTSQEGRPEARTDRESRNEPGTSNSSDRSEANFNDQSLPFVTLAPAVLEKIFPWKHELYWC